MRLDFFPAFCGGYILSGFFVDKRGLLKDLENLHLYDYLNRNKVYERTVLSNLKYPNLQVYFILTSHQLSGLLRVFEVEGLNEIISCKELHRERNPNSGNTCITYVTHLDDLRKTLEKYKE